jgi:hypothetical protein
MGKLTLRLSAVVLDSNKVTLSTVETSMQIATRPSPEATKDAMQWSLDAVAKLADHTAKQAWYEAGLAIEPTPPSDPVVLESHQDAN